MSTKATTAQRDFSRKVWDHVTQSVRDFIEEESRVIHPDYREIAVWAIRYMSGEAIFVDKTIDEARAIGVQIDGFLGLSIHDEIKARVREHALSIAQDAMTMRKEAFERVKCGWVPKPAYTNPSPPKSTAAHKKSGHLRLV